MLCQLKVHTQNFSGMSGRHEWSSLHLLQLNSTGLRCMHMHHRNQHNIPLQMKQKLVQDEEGGKKKLIVLKRQLQDIQVSRTDYLNLKNSA